MDAIRLVEVTEELGKMVKEEDIELDDRDDGLLVEEAEEEVPATVDG